MSIDEIERVARALDLAAAPVSFDEAIHRGTKQRRARRSRAVATVATLLAAAVVAVDTANRNPTQPPRVTATNPSTTASLPAAARVAPPPATTTQFSDLGRLRTWLANEISTTAETPSIDVRTEITHGSLRDLAPSGISSSKGDLPVYIVQLTGSAFRCNWCVVKPRTEATALRAAWDPAAHSIAAFELGRPTDLGRIDSVFSIDVLPWPRYTPKATLLPVGNRSGVVGYVELRYVYGPVEYRGPSRWPGAPITNKSGTQLYGFAVDKVGAVRISLARDARTVAQLKSCRGWIEVGDGTTQPPTTAPPATTCQPLLAQLGEPFGLAAAP